MTKLATTEAVRRSGSYSHAVVSWIDDNGYPTTVGTDFGTEPESSTVTLGPFPSGMKPASGQKLCVTFSHIRPQKGVGYDERRYINIWGEARPTAENIEVVASRAAGWDEAEVPFFEYAERNVPRARNYLSELGATVKLSPFWTFFLATRLPFLTATLSPVVLGAVVAGRDGAFTWGTFLLVLLGATAVHLGLNMANDLFDDANGADQANVTPTMFSGGSRVIQYGLVSRSSMFKACAAFYAVAIGIGVFLAATRSWSILWLGMVGIALSLAYSAPPLRLVHRGLGEPVTALGFGPVMALGTYIALARTWAWEPVLASIPVAILVALILYVNQVPDRVGDAAVGKRTLIVRWPKDRVIGVYVGLAAIALASIVANVAFGVTPVWTLLGILPFPLALKVRRGMKAHYDQPYALMSYMQDNITLHLGVSVLLIVGYAIHMILG